MRVKSFGRIFKHFPTFSEEVFYGNNISFQKSCLSPVSAEISSGFLVETFWQDVQNCISIVQKSMITEKKLLLEKVDFFQIWTWIKCFLKVLRQHRQLREIAIQVSTETFWRKNVLFLTDTKLFRLRTLTDAILNIQRKLFCQLCQYGIQRIQRNDWMKFLSYKQLELFYHFWTLNEKPLDFLPENFVRVVENALACPGYVSLLLLFFLWKLCKVYLSFLYFDWFSFIFGWIFFGRVCKTALYVPEDLFEEKQLVLVFFFNSSTVSGIERKFFGFMAETVRQLCQKCTFSARGTKRRKLCSEKFYHFLTIFWLQGGSFRTLSGIFQKFRQNRNFCFQRSFLD